MRSYQKKQGNMHRCSQAVNVMFRRRRQNVGNIFWSNLKKLLCFLTLNMAISMAVNLSGCTSQSYERKFALPHNTGRYPSNVLSPAPTSPQHFEGTEELMHLANIAYGKTILFDAGSGTSWIPGAARASVQWSQHYGWCKARAELPLLPLACEGQAEIMLWVEMVFWISMWQDKGMHPAGRRQFLCCS